jgi:hypothetical protein
MRCTVSDTLSVCFHHGPTELQVHMDSISLLTIPCPECRNPIYIAVWLAQYFAGKTGNM